MTFAPVSASAQQLSNEERDQYQKVAKAYSQHLFTSMCAQNYRDELSVAGMTDEAKRQTNQQTTKACECMYDRISKDVESYEITDYVMYTYSPSLNQKGDAIDPDALKYFGSQRIQKIGVFFRDKPLMKKCGFNKRINHRK